MDGIERKAPIGKEDTRNKYLKTLRYSPKFSVIDAVQPIRPASNQLNNAKPTLMFNIDILYAHADDMLDAYKRLNDRGKKFRELVKAFKEDPEGFIGQIMELVKQFNQTTASVLTFDRVFQTRHSEVLSDILARQQFNLEKMGIRIVGMNQLEFNEPFFRRAVRNNPSFFETVFLTGLTLFDRAFTIISGIRIPVEAPPSRSHSPVAVEIKKTHFDQKV